MIHIDPELLRALAATTPLCIFVLINTPRFFKRFWGAR